MDGIEELKGVVILAATNRLDIIDPALLRGGRFDLVMKLPFPDEDARLSIFKIHTKNKPLSSDVDLLKLTQETENIPGSDIEFICRKASMIAVREYINQGSEGKGWKSEARSQKPDRKKEKGKEQKRGVTELKISKRHFEEALRLAREQRDSIEEIE
jgi:transitional endoplasmic reticulum ATPase